MTTKFDELMLDPEFRKLNAIEGLVADAAQLIADLLEERNMKQAELAKRLNKTPAFVSQLLSGKANMTIRTLAEVVYALGARVKVGALEEGSISSIDAVGCEQPTEAESFHSFRLFRTQLPRPRTKFEFRIKESERSKLSLSREVGHSPTEGVA